eukprot:10971151-Ditylum_brightwellii.AAC.1
MYVHLLIQKLTIRTEICQIISGPLPETPFKVKGRLYRSDKEWKSKHRDDKLFGDVKGNITLWGELCCLDIKTHNMQTMYGQHHPKGN